MTVKDIQMLIDDGLLAFLKVGKQTRVTEQALARFMEESERRLPPAENARQRAR